MKYEAVFVRGYETVGELGSGLERYFGLYNDTHHHQSLDDQTPHTVYQFRRGAHRSG